MCRNCREQTMLQPYGYVYITPQKPCTCRCKENKQHTPQHCKKCGHYTHPTW